MDVNFFEPGDVWPTNRLSASGNGALSLDSSSEEPA